LEPGLLKIKKHIPNTLTCGNLVCGCIAIVQAMQGYLEWACYLVGLALIFDFLDGFLARILKVSSPVGKDLDSLADMVTFGVAPGIVMFNLMLIGLKSRLVIEPGWHTTLIPLNLLAYFSLVIPVFSCIRLAKFNNDPRQSDSFIGLPTPANAMVICSFPLIFNVSHVIDYSGPWFNPYLLCAVSLILSILLISPIPLFALKFSEFSWKNNKLRYVFLVLSVVLFLALNFAAIPLVVALYIFMSIVNNIFLKKSV
jgi:CDP-diacylglycerol--serine O-phosphatidyltransferase